MKTKNSETLAVQIIKKQRVEKEFSWISAEFENLRTLADLELDNAPYQEALKLGLIE